MENTVNMTNSQAETLVRILHAANDFDYSRGNGEYEIKKYEVKDYGFFLSVELEAGMVGDEGTLASILCRESVHLFVGKRGGIKYSFVKDGEHCTEALTSMNLLTVHIAQNHH